MHSDEEGATEVITVSGVPTKYGHLPLIEQIVAVMTEPLTEESTDVEQDS